MTTINLNQTVRVKLTDKGRRINEQIHHAFVAALKERNSKITLPAYTPPVEDADGWSNWQLWDLMARFGWYIDLGSAEQPFEYTIEVVQ